MGTLLAEVTTVDDDLGEIAAGLKSCLGRKPEFVVVVGGLGPTPDDMTLKGVSGAVGVELRLNEKALSLIKEHYSKRNLGRIEITPARKKMAILPEGAEPVRNDVGTAPGVKLDVDGTSVFCLPGVPSEMKSIFRKSIEPRIAERLGRLHRKYFALKIEGIYESALAPLIDAELRKHPGAYIKSHPRGIKEGRSRIELDVAVVSEDKKKAEDSAARIVQSIQSRIGAAGAKVVSVRDSAP